VAKENFSESILIVATTQMLYPYLGNFWVIEFYCAAVNNFENYLNQVRVMKHDKVWFTVLVCKK